MFHDIYLLNENYKKLEQMNLTLGERHISTFTTRNAIIVTFETTLP